MYEHGLYDRRRVKSIAVSLMVIFTLVLAALPLFSSVRSPASAMNLANLPLSFVPNAGQLPSLVKFQVHSAKNSLFFTPNDIILLLRNAGGAPALVNLHYIGANLRPTTTGVDPLPGKASYLRGTDPARWLTDLPTFGAITYENLYPGIDLRFDGVLGELKGTFTVAPGIDPTVIRWRHMGWVEVSLDEETGSLIIAVSAPGNVTLTLVEAPPVVSQVIDGAEVPVDAAYVIHADGSVGFELGDYDPDYPLIIDPTLTYSTYLGGSSIEDVEGIGTDGNGNMYVVGTTTSWDFPTANPLDGTLSGDDDVYVAKLNAAGDALLYSTYIGGSEDDEGNALVVDAAGNAYITGATDSSNFPTKNAYQGTLKGLEDAFVAKLNPSGNSLVYSTYLGGSHIDDGAGIAIDAAGAAYVIGMTFSSNFPTQGALQPTYGGGTFAASGDAFITKLTAGGDALAYSTYLGGSATDAGAAIAVDGVGNAYVVGETWSNNFPTQNPLQAARAGQSDLFVAKVNAAGSALVYSTYLGGTHEEHSYAIAVDGLGHAYVTGNTLSTNYPTMNPLQAALAGQSDAFVTKLSAAGNALVYSTYLGGRAYDKGSGIAVNSAGEAYITGDTAAADFPVESSMQSYGGESDAFLLRLSGDGTDLLYSTYLGGSAGDYGVAVVVDSAGTATLAGVTFSTNFPMVNPLYDTYSGEGDVFIAKISDEPGPTPTPAPNFSGTLKAASDDIVTSGGTLTYTISLHNSGEEPGTASVIDPLPAGLEYVAGSAESTGGVYDSDTRTVSWTDVAVAAGDTEELTFAVVTTAVIEPTVITNAATVMTDGTAFKRYAAVLVLPTTVTEPNLILSHKLASKPEVTGGEVVTFTVKLINTGGAPATVTVTDPLPEGLDYVPDSAAGTGGVYDSDTRTISWTGVTVATNDSVTLTFAATTTEVTAPRVITNRATIAYDTVELERVAVVIVAPASLPVPPAMAPVVHQVVIGTQDVLTDVEVTLYISATDDVGVEWMHIREWYLETEPMPHWEVIKTTEWLPFDAEVAWTLHPASGVHFVGVWVADADYNVSLPNLRNLDYASLLLPGKSVPAGGFVPYMVHYEAGEAVTAVLDPVSGDPDLYVWYPGNFGLPNAKSTNSGTVQDSVNFTTPTDGAYLFLVHGYTAATYDLSITPGGVAEPHGVTFARSGNTAGLNNQRNAQKPAMLFEPIFSQSGLDPINGTSLQPQHSLFLPMVGH